MRPFWRYFGGKWKTALRYPSPRYATIIEPFAGAAGYSLRYHDCRVILVERYHVVAEVWRWLINASEAEIRAVPDVECVDDLPAGLAQGAYWLVGFMLGAGDSRPRHHISPMVRRDGKMPMALVAQQAAAIRHWRIIEGDYWEAPDVEGTWFIDPPYRERGSRDHRAGARSRVRYPHGGDAIDYAALATWTITRPGQVIACENEGATWLPFSPLLTANAAAPGARSREAVWTNAGGPVGPP